jgi:hypothetical protein
MKQSWTVCVIDTIRNTKSTNHKESALKSKLLAALAINLVIACGFSCAFAQTSTHTVKRPVISDAERAVDIQAVANIMGRHAYYHGAGKNCEELDAIWAKHPPTVNTFTNPSGAWTGDHIRSSYCEANLDTERKALVEVRKQYPEVPDSDASLAAGEFLIHTLTTPIIEIAGDGKTAKGMWYSPGIGLGATDGKEGKPGGIFFYEKYGVDFIKEDGQWKIWHIQMFYDYTGTLEHGVADVPVKLNVKKEAGEMQAVDPRMKQDKTNPNPYQEWSPTRIPVMVPTPAPYYMFSETFSY